MQETQEKAREVAGQAQDRAREAAGQARGRISQEMDRRSSQAGEQVSSNASDARSVADELRKQGKDAPARYVEQAADRAERLGGYLQESDGDRILRDVEDFARRTCARWPRSRSATAASTTSCSSTCRARRRARRSWPSTCAGWGGRRRPSTWRRWPS